MAKEQPLRLLVGLGNPGPRYLNSRHNVGFHVLERAAREWRAEPWYAAHHSLVCRAQLGRQALWLARPHTFMNRSGRAVANLVAETGVEIPRLIVVHDDLDLPFGRLRVRRKGGHGGHNGVRSLLETLPDGRFVRLKVGIGRPAPQQDVVEHVLSPFTPDEEARLPELLARAVQELSSLVVEGPDRAMSSLSH